jgi:hypothetical protein
MDYYNVFVPQWSQISTNVSWRASKDLPIKYNHMILGYQVFCGKNSDIDEFNNGGLALSGHF